jgi:hypothetical protein
MNRTHSLFFSLDILLLPELCFFPVVFARHSRALYFAFLALRLRVCVEVQNREVLMLLPRFAACVLLLS